MSPTLVVCRSPDVGPTASGVGCRFGVFITVTVTVTCRDKQARKSPCPVRGLRDADRCIAGRLAHTEFSRRILLFTDATAYVGGCVRRLRMRNAGRARARASAYTAALPGLCRSALHARSRRSLSLYSASHSWSYFIVARYAVTSARSCAGDAVRGLGPWCDSFCDHTRRVGCAAHLLLLEAWERHVRAFDVLLRIGEVVEHGLICPHDARVDVSLRVLEAGDLPP
jgi:hypothetical protein